MLARLERFFATDDDITLLVSRVATGLVMFPHGAQKLFGWFGGRGFDATMSSFQERLGLPAFVALLVILGESLGALSLVAGFASRFCAFGIVLTMAGALTRHLDHGFFMNWSGQQGGEGFEYHLLAIAMAVAVMIRGSGALSVDRVLQRSVERTSGVDTTEVRPAVA